MWAEVSLDKMKLQSVASSPQRASVEVTEQRYQSILITAKRHAGLRNTNTAAFTPASPPQPLLGAGAVINGDSQPEGVIFFF